MGENSGIIEQYAAHLEAKATRLVIRSTMLLGFLGAVLGGFPLLYTKYAVVPSHLGFATLLLGAGAGAYLGYTMGERKAIEIRMQAQLALHQLQVEQSLMRGVVRPQAPVAQAPAPAAQPAPAPVVQQPAPAPVVQQPVPVPVPAPVAQPVPAPVAQPAPPPVAPVPVAPAPIAPPPVVPVSPVPVSAPPVVAPAAPAPIAPAPVVPAPAPAPVAPPPVTPAASLPRLVEPQQMPPLSSAG